MGKLNGGEEGGGSRVAKKATTFYQIHVSQVLNIQQKIFHRDHQICSWETTH